MNAPATTERKSFLPLRLRSTTIVGSSNIPTASHQTKSMPLTGQNDTKSLLTVGSRVLVNGLKNGTLRYIDSVEFAEGLFCGVELDEPDGKHDGQVNNIRYFQCKTNHGIFVPRDKVILAPRERSYTIQRRNSYVKPPAIKRSMTITSSNDNNNKNEQSPIKQPPVKTTQLPDIIPDHSTSTQPVPIITELHEIVTLTENKEPIVSIQPLTNDEPPETITFDFTDSVSLLIHQLEQKQQSSLNESRPSLTISEEGTIDESDDDDDESDVESVAESMFSERISLSSINNLTKSIQTDLSIDINENITIMKANLSNASSTTSLNKYRMNSMENLSKKRTYLPTPTSTVKRNVPERKLSVPSDKITTTFRKPSLPVPNTPRKLSLTSPKPKPSTESQPKFNRSLSSSTSVNSSQSDLTINAKKSTELTRKILPSINFNPIKQSDEYLKKQYRHVLNQFDLINILSQYYINQNEQIKRDYEVQLSKVRRKNNQLKTAHENELIVLNKQNEDTINSMKKTHKQEIDKLLNEKLEFETRCISLQKEVDRFMYEMENSEYADPLLRRVEILEKDRGSLETVLELRTQELTQLRTRMNEQTFEREEQLVLLKRIEVAETRNNDLTYLLRNWQLTEKSVTLECEQLKEQLAQLERDNRQLTFENETLLYSLRQRSPTISNNSFSSLIVHSKLPRPNRAHSFTSIIPTTETNHMKPALSLNCILLKR